MNLFHWIAGSVLALAWFSRIVDAALGMPKIADVSKPEWERKPAEKATPRVSIIVPARNEEEHIAETLRLLLALDYENYEVIGVNDRSTDRTWLAEGDPRCGVAGRMAGENPCHVDGGEACHRGLAAVHRR